MYFLENCNMEICREMSVNIFFRDGHLFQYALVLHILEIQEASCVSQCVQLA